MEWLNVHVSTLRSAEYIGSSPVERATWLSVLSWCCEQENSGRIADAASWKDRQWQQTCGATLREVKSCPRLLVWDGNDLVIKFYPVDKELEVKKKRESGRTGGIRSGEIRASSTQRSSASSTASSTASDELQQLASTEGNGREGKEKAMLGSTLEIPNGMPKDEKDAVRLAGIVAIPESYIRERFTACMSVGFVDGAGRAIRSWPHYLQTSYQQAKQREADSAKKGQKSPGYEAPLKFV